MAKKNVVEYVCQQCGAVYPKWQGKCDSCGEWNTIEEEKAQGGGFSILPNKKKGDIIELMDEGGRIILWDFLLIKVWTWE